MRNFCFNSNWVRNVNFSFSSSFLFTFSPFIIFIFQMNLLWDGTSLLRKINFASFLLFLLRYFFHRAHKISKWIGPVNNLLIFILWLLSNFICSLSSWFSPSCHKNLVCLFTSFCFSLPRKLCFFMGTTRGVH